MDSLQQMQDRYLTLGAEINIAAQMRTQYEDVLLEPDSNTSIPYLESRIAEQTAKIVELRKKRDALHIYLTIKGALPDEDAWRHPKGPDQAFLDELRAGRKADKVTKEAAKMEMQNVTPPAKKKSTRKGAAIKSKTVKVKKEKP